MDKHASMKPLGPNEDDDPSAHLISKHQSEGDAEVEPKNSDLFIGLNVDTIHFKQSIRQTIKTSQQNQLNKRNSVFVPKKQSKMRQCLEPFYINITEALLGAAVRFAILISTIKWAIIVSPMAFGTSTFFLFLFAAVGCACGGFLWTLEQATKLRIERFPWFLYLLPAAGICIGLLYYLGDDKKNKTSKGNNSILSQINKPDPTKGRVSIPTRMAPMVYIGTIVTHLFGGSAGREGTAIQMAASIASTYYMLLRLTTLRLSKNSVRTLMISSIAAGFGGVFGVPITGAVFAIEVLSIGRVGYEALIPCLISSVLSDWSTRWILRLLHSEHTDYHPLAPSLSQSGYLPNKEIDWIIVAEMVVTGIFCGFAATLFTVFFEKFAEFFNFTLKAFKKIVEPKKIPFLKPILGGAIIIALNFAVPQGHSYLGIGTASNDFTCADIANLTNPHNYTVTISSSFCKGGAAPYSWLMKEIFTTVTLSSGFKGGEVTPLFYIGAALGNAIGEMFQSKYVDLFAATGFVAIFSGATNTPIACTIMGIELFGGNHPVYICIACFVAYMASGFSSIYAAQAVSIGGKIDGSDQTFESLKEASEDHDNGIKIFRVMHDKVLDWFSPTVDLPEVEENQHLI